MAKNQKIMEITKAAGIVRIFVTMLVILLSYFAIRFMHESMHPTNLVQYELEMTLITGQKIKRIYELPANTTFTVTTNRGSYTLEYRNSQHHPAGKYFGVIKNGIVDYKVLRQWK